MRRLTLLLSGVAIVAGCSAPTTQTQTQTQTAGPATGSAPSASGSATGASAGKTSASAPDGGEAFTVRRIATYDQPWAMAFLPGTPYAAITERGGRLLIRDMQSGEEREAQNVPEVAVAGQGGLGDILPAPSYEEDQRVYLSWVQEGDGGRSGAVVGLGRLVVDADSARIENLNLIWEQEPKVEGDGHFGHRLAVSPDDRYLFVSSGDRQKFDPAQDLSVNLGKILRLNLDGTPAAGNPFADRGAPADQIWSYGHRNPLGLAFDGDGNLWESEMGPKGGDEINLITPGKNYGWPEASNGSHYSGEDIPDHIPGDGFEAPKAWWNPSISPGSLMIYSGDAFPSWRGDAFVGALSGESLIRVGLDGSNAEAAEEWSDGDLGARLREVEQAPDGSIYVLRDGDDGDLLQLSPS